MLVSPLLDAAPPCAPSVSFSADPPAVAVSCCLFTLDPITVALSSSNADYSVCSPPHLALSSALPSMLLPLTRYFSPVLTVLLFSGGSSDRLRHPAAVFILPSAYLVSCPSSSVIRGVPHPFLLWSPTPLPPPRPCRGLLRQPAPLLAPPPPPPAVTIARKDKDVGNWTGGDEACWLAAGGSALCGKIPSRPLAVVADGISCPRFLYWPQH